MERPSQDLVEEHSDIMMMLQIMAKVATKLHQGAEIPKEHLLKITEFLTVYVDKCHHGKEEQVLFPEVVNISEDKVLVTELLGEHQTGRDLIQGIKEAVNVYPSASEGIHIAVNCDDLIKLYVDHVRKENTVLFPLADKQIPGTLKQSMKERYDKFELEAIGEGKHEQYHGWLDELKQAYLD